jgi:hypothetical protein
MARSSTAASKPANVRKDAARSDNSGPLSREQRLEDYVLPQTSDIVMALRKLAAY